MNLKPFLSASSQSPFTFIGHKYVDRIINLRKHNVVLWVKWSESEALKATCFKPKLALRSIVIVFYILSTAVDFEEPVVWILPDGRSKNSGFWKLQSAWPSGMRRKVHNSNCDSAWELLTSCFHFAVPCNSWWLEKDNICSLEMFIMIWWTVASW